MRMSEKMEDRLATAGVFVITSIPIGLGTFALSTAFAGKAVAAGIGVAAVVATHGTALFFSRAPKP